MEKDSVIFLSENISYLLGIPGRLFESNELIETITTVNLKNDPYEYHKKEIVWGDESISYFVTSDKYTYCRVMSPIYTLILGPFTYFPKKDQEYKDLAFRMSLGKNDYQAFINAITSINRMPLIAVLQSLITFNFVLNDEKKTLEELLVRQDIADEYQEEAESSKIEAQDIAQTRNSTLAIEQTLTTLVRSGDIDGFNKWLKNAPSIRSGSLSNDYLRQQKNTLIVSATIFSRAAIEGGLEYNEALDISDMYIQKCENCRTQDEISTINYLLVKDLIERVHAVQAKNSPLETSVANYVLANLSNQITLDDVCDALYMSKSNLCSRFKNETGKTVLQFVMEKKIEECKRLLTTTNKPIVTISLYLGFSSQAHLSKAFKDITGMSPIKYRKLKKI